MKHVAEKLRELLSETIQYYNDGPEHQLQTLSDQCMNTKTQTLGVNNHMGSVSVEGSAVKQDGEISTVTGKKCMEIRKENFIGEQNSLCVHCKDLEQTGTNLEQKERFPCNDVSRTGDSVKESGKSACRCGWVTEVDSFSCNKADDNAGIRDGNVENSINSISKQTGLHCSCASGDSSVENTTKEDTTTDIPDMKEPKITYSLIKRGSPILEELVHQVKT